MVEWTPRVKGKPPGSPILGCGREGSAGSAVGTAEGPYRSSTTYPEMVTVSGSTEGFCVADVSRALVLAVMKVIVGGTAPRHPYTPAPMSMHPRAEGRTALLAVALVLALLPVSAGCAKRRPVQSDADLLSERAALQQALAENAQGAFVALAERLHERRKSDPGATLDVLVLSGGGDWGAFGTGLLVGWSEAADPKARMPRFDVVSGVSTGALIAPFAFLGTKEDLAQVDGLYRNPKPDWIRTRGLLFFLPDHASFAEVPGLEREVDRFITEDLARRVADESRAGRILLINTTNLDDGSAQPFRWGRAAQAAVETHDMQRLRNILLASSGIPGAFPPREIDGSLYVDGAVTSNIIYGGAVRRQDSFGATWKRRYPGEPVPTLRYWVVLNNYAAAQPQTVQPNWPSVIQRSLEVAVRASTTIALRHLYAMAEVTRLRGDGEVEVRWAAVPNSWKPPEEGIFREATMRSLSDLGRTMGADPGTWQSESP